MGRASLANGTGVRIDASGILSNVSVNSASDASLKQLRSTIPHKQVGVTTVGDIRRAGGNVVRSPTKNIHITAQCVALHHRKQRSSSHRQFRIRMENKNVVQATIQFGERNGFKVDAGNSLLRDGRRVTQVLLTRSDGVLVATDNFMHADVLDTGFYAQKGRRRLAHCEGEMVGRNARRGGQRRQRGRCDFRKRAEERAARRPAHKSREIDSSTGTLIKPQRGLSQLRSVRPRDPDRSPRAMNLAFESPILAASESCRTASSAGSRRSSAKCEPFINLKSGRA